MLSCHCMIDIPIQKLKTARVLLFCLVLSACSLFTYMVIIDLSPPKILVYNYILFGGSCPDYNFQTGYSSMVNMATVTLTACIAVLGIAVESVVK